MDDLQLIGVGFLVLLVPLFLLLRFLCKRADEKGQYFHPVMFGLGAIVLVVGMTALPKLVSLILSGRMDMDVAFFSLFFFLPALVGAVFIAHAWTKDGEILATRLAVLVGVFFLIAGLFGLFSGVAVYNSGRTGGTVAYRDSNPVVWLAITAIELGGGIYLIYSAIKNKDKLFAGF